MISTRRKVSDLWLTKRLKGTDDNSRIRKLSDVREGALEMLENIPVFVPHIQVDTIKHIMDAFDIGWLGMGEFTKEFEERIADYLGLENRYVVATNTGTSALHIGLLVTGVGPGDEVITTSFNYVADHQAIVATGAEVVMCDIREDNLGIDCEKAEALITERTKAILPCTSPESPATLMVFTRWRKNTGSGSSRIVATHSAREFEGRVSAA